MSKNELTFFRDFHIAVIGFHRLYIQTAKADERKTREGISYIFCGSAGGLNVVYSSKSRVWR